MNSCDHDTPYYTGHRTEATAEAVENPEPKARAAGRCKPGDDHQQTTKATSARCSKCSSYRVALTHAATEQRSGQQHEQAARAIEFQADGGGPRSGQLERESSRQRRTRRRARRGHRVETTCSVDSGNVSPVRLCFIPALPCVISVTSMERVIFLVAALLSVLVSFDLLQLNSMGRSSVTRGTGLQ